MVGHDAVGEEVACVVVVVAVEHNKVVGIVVEEEEDAHHKDVLAEELGCIRDVVHNNCYIGNYNRNQQQQQVDLHLVVLQKCRELEDYRSNVGNMLFVQEFECCNNVDNKHHIVVVFQELDCIVAMLVVVVDVADAVADYEWPTEGSLFFYLEGEPR